MKWSESRSIVSKSLQPHGLYSPWNSPGQNTGVGSLSLLQGIFPTQGLNPGLPHCRWILNQLSQRGSPIVYAAAARFLQLCLTFVQPQRWQPTRLPIPGILQPRTLEWVVISFSNAWKVKSENEITQSCLTPSDPMDCSLPGSSIHRILQARVPEWVAIAISAIVYRIEDKWLWLIYDFYFQQYLQSHLPSPNVPDIVAQFKFPESLMLSHA